jgi:hypothetical protein
MPHTANCAPVDELLLPACVRDVLAAARAARPGQHLTCISFHTEDDGHESECMEPDPELIARMTANAASRLHRRNVLVLSVRVTETTFDSVHTRTHVLVTETDLYDRTKAAHGTR